ncbi:MAG: phosphatase PAP2 family protein [Muribaculaceae bacterium]|nr:phosphatase PAP2 family protein [Muribaculaceae bacterium]
MKIDTSSYYPETGGEEGFSLNRRETTLFGEVKKEEDSAVPTAEERKADTNPRPEPEVPPKEWERVVSGASHFLSWVLVPLLMPVYGLLLAFSLSILDLAPMSTRVGFTLIVAGINVLVPMMLVLLLKKMGIVDDLGLNGRKERLIPYIISIVALAGTAVFMYYKGAPHWLVWFFGGGAVGGCVNLIVNFWWKISAHAAGIAGVVALLVRIARDGNPHPAVFGWLIASIIIAGLLGSSRVWLGRHTVWQVMAGLLVGFTSVILFT